MKRALKTLCWPIIALTFEGAIHCSAATPTNVYYRYDMVAETGTGFTGFELPTSINDHGQVGFVGQLNNSGNSFESVYRGDGSAPATLLSPGFSGSTRDFSGFIQINNVGEVVARDRSSGSPPVFFVRKWNGSPAVVARSGASPENFDSVVLPNMNNAGEVSYIALRSSPVVVTEVRLSTGSGDIAVATYTSLPGPRPMLADTGDIVFRDPNNRIVVWNRTGTQVAVIASTSSTFTSLGDSPGISDDGSIVGFVGDRGQGQGVFLSIANGGNPRILVRVAGENGSPSLPPTPDLGFNANGSPIRFASLNALSRVGVLRLPPVSSGNPGQRIVVCFMGTPTSAKSVSTGVHDVFSAQAGIWIARLDLRTSPAVQTILHPCVPVAQVGDMIGTRTITGLGIHDPIAKAVIDDSGNPCPPTRPDHWIAFWASTASGQFIARAVPFPIVVYPPIRQGNPLWATKRYAPDQVDAYLATLPVMDAERTALQAALPGINLRQKGCAMSSYAMCLNFLLDQTGLTTETIHDQFADRLTPIQKTTITAALDPARAGQMSGILKWKPPGTMTIPVFNGADLLHSDVWNAFHVEGTITDDGIDQTITDDVTELAAANREGHPVLLNINGGGHWVMSKGITGCAGGDPLFDVVDPGSSNGSLDGLKTAGTMNLKKGIILKRRLLFPPPPAAFAGFRPASGEPALVTVQTEGAIHLVITRPGGQRVGFDSATGTHYAEISGSSYSPEFPISEPENGYDNAEAAALLDSIPRVIQFASIVDEIITIGVRASQTGPFSLRFDGTTGSDELGKFVLSGWLAAGGVTNLTAQIKTPAPPLTIVAQSSGNVTLGWPLTCPTCILESAGALSAAWTAVTNAPVVNAPNYNMTLPSTGLRRFFRLAK